MARLYRYQLPRFAERGVQARPTADIRDSADNAEQTATSGTYSLFAGSRVVIDADAVLTVGPPATATIGAAITADESLSATWQERWILTFGTTVETFVRPVYVVRFVPRQVITDADLFTRHTQLDRLRDRDEADFSTQREEAWTWVERQLINRGNRPELILDSSELREVHIFKTLHILYRDYASSTAADQRYAELAEEYDLKAIAEMSDVHLSYDTDQDGTFDEGEKRSASPILLTNRPPRWV